jgi:hypothetical protein
MTRSPLLVSPLAAALILLPRGACPQGQPLGPEIK